MARPDRIDNEVLREAGLALMHENGKPLTKRPSFGRIHGRTRNYPDLFEREGSRVRCHPPNEQVDDQP